MDTKSAPRRHRTDSAMFSGKSTSTTPGRPHGLGVDNDRVGRLFSPAAGACATQPDLASTCRVLHTMRNLREFTQYDSRLEARGWMRGRQFNAEVAEVRAVLARLDAQRARAEAFQIRHLERDNATPSPLIGSFLGLEFRADTVVDRRESSSATRVPLILPRRRAVFILVVEIFVLFVKQPRPPLFGGVRLEGPASDRGFKMAIAASGSALTQHVSHQALRPAGLLDLGQTARSRRGWPSAGRHPHWLWCRRHSALASSLHPRSLGIIGQLRTPDEIQRLRARTESRFLRAAASRAFSSASRRSRRSI